MALFILLFTTGCTITKWDNLYVKNIVSIDGDKIKNVGEPDKEV